MGTELKTVACATTGVMLGIEIQRGKEAMREAAHANKLGVQAACTIRLASLVNNKHDGDNDNHLPTADTTTQVSRKQIIIGDSWFGSVKAAVKLGKANMEFIGNIKGSYHSFPKDYIMNTLRNESAGTSILLTATVDGVELQAIGWKFNKKSTQMFVATKYAGSIRNGTPYIQKFPDEFGNVFQREVPRPAVLSTYYACANTVDKHNHVRQHLLALESAWVTCNQWFRVYTTIVGMHVIDSMKLYCHFTGRTCMSTSTYINKLCFQLLHNSTYYGPLYNRNTVESHGTDEGTHLTPTLSVITDFGSHPVNNTESTQMTVNTDRHIPTLYPFSTKVRQSNGEHFRLQRACTVCKGEGVTHYTSYQCEQCGVSLCRDGVGNKTANSLNAPTTRYCFRYYHGYQEE